MSYNVLDVSRYIINYCNENYYLISNLKLQKILYFVQAFFLEAKNEECFREEIEAWDFGPVVPEAYREYRKYGGNNIPPIEEYIDKSRGIWHAVTKEFDVNIISESDRELINQMVNQCSSYSASELVEITHGQRPWINAYIKGFNNVISKEDISEYFRGILNG